MFAQTGVRFDDISDVIPRVVAVFSLTYGLEIFLLPRDVYSGSQRLLPVLLPGSQQGTTSPPKEINQARRPDHQNVFWLIVSRADNGLRWWYM